MFKARVLTQTHWPQKITQKLYCSQWSHMCFSASCEYPILEPYTSSFSDIWPEPCQLPSLVRIGVFLDFVEYHVFNVTLITPHSTNRFPHQLAFLKGGKIWAHMGTSFVSWPSGSSGFWNPGLPPRVRRKPSDDCTWHCATPPCHHQYPPRSSVPGVQPKVEEQFL